MLAVIGSVALSTQLGVPSAASDIDIVGPYNELKPLTAGKNRACYPTDGGKKLIIKKHDGSIIEAEIAWPGSLAEELHQLILDDTETLIRSGCAHASLDVLYMLKMSHRFLKNSPHFKKTMTDIWELRRAGARIRLMHMDFFKRREAATYTYGHPKLNVMKSDFFNGDGVTYVYDHDSIHQAIKHFDKPAYEYFKRPGSDVMCDKALFDATPYDIKLHAVLEEAYVLALERSQIPFPGVRTPDQSFDMALEKVCTSITSGWFREFAWDNWYAVRALYRDDYVDRFNASPLKRKL